MNPALLVALIAAPTAQPSITIVPPPQERREPAPLRVEMREVPEIVPLRIEVRHGRDVLWRGTLHVQALNNSAYSQSLTEPAKGCTRPGNRNTTRLTVDVTRFRPGDRADDFRVHVRWDRPVEPVAPVCHSNSRTIEFGQTITLPAGKFALVTGDGGMSVSLYRSRTLN